ncbi:MAG: YitT family protein [Clostridia bacterium]|nr:YitT family protein [Clostridia bacterium]
MYNIHSVSSVTEGGILGLTLLGEHWLDLSPAVSGFLLNAVCYVFGWKTLGRDFIGYSAIAGGGFSVFYALFEQFPAVYPQIAQMPLVAALVGAVFVGLGAGLCVRAGGAPCGDDALAMALSARLKVRIQWVYLVSDLLVLGLSLTYIPFNRIAYSLLTVVLSGQLIGFVQRFKVKK